MGWGGITPGCVLGTPVGDGYPMEGSAGRSPMGTGGPLIGIRMGAGGNGGLIMGTPRCSRNRLLLTYNVGIGAWRYIYTCTWCMAHYLKERDTRGSKTVILRCLGWDIWTTSLGSTQMFSPIELQSSSAGYTYKAIIRTKQCRAPPPCTMSIANVHTAALYVHSWQLFSTCTCICSQRQGGQGGEHLGWAPSPWRTAPSQTLLPVSVLLSLSTNTHTHIHSYSMTCSTCILYAIISCTN